MSKPMTVPAPRFEYQGASLGLLEVDLKIGPFSFPTYPGLGFGHRVGHATSTDGVPQVTVRPASFAPVPKNPPSAQIAMGYEQLGVEWDMAFSIETDPKGGLVGCATELDVASNYPQIPMTLSKFTINQPGIGTLIRGTLPKDYAAAMTLRFWFNGKTEPPVDAWLLVQVAYVLIEGRGKVYARPEEVPLVPVGELVLFPAHQDSSGGILGDNYPAQVRKRRAHNQ